MLIDQYKQPYRLNQLTVGDELGFEVGERLGDADGPDVG